MYNITSILSERQKSFVNLSHIPKRPSDGCPLGTIDGGSTCYCEEHCSWHKCRLSEPPKDCPGVCNWEWDSLRMYWVAKGTS